MRNRCLHAQRLQLLMQLLFLWTGLVFANPCTFRNYFCQLELETCHGLVLNHVVC